MDGYDANKKYESHKIPSRQQDKASGAVQSLPLNNAAAPPSLADDGMFYEIEYDSCPIPRVGKFVLKPQKIIEPAKDEIRELFGRMRNIASEHRLRCDYPRLFNRQILYDNAEIFYEQGMFMKDFTDSYNNSVPFSQYFPYYQMMGYEQLRTYFTWRGEVRKGNIADISLSYAFLYIYELLGNIGVKSPQDGLDRLMNFWKAFGVYNKSLDSFMISWLKDYHIYYELPHSFKEFVNKNGLAEYYPKLTDTDDSFNLFCAISKYDIKKSAFFTNNTSKMIIDCFIYVIEWIRRDFAAAGLSFDDVFFRPTRKIINWKPFRGALFHSWLKQPDRRIVLAENEIYICQKNVWTFSSVITSEKGRQFIGYVMKQMEAVLRKVTKYKFKLNANTDMINDETIRKLSKAGLFIEKIVPAAVEEYYREANKTVVTIDHSSLARIRQESLITQKSLLVEEQAEQKEVKPDTVLWPAPDQNIFADSSFDAPPVCAATSWENFKDILSENELQALLVILRGNDLKAFANERNIMLEVLIDGINEKALDCIGDNLTDEEFVLYDDYKDKVKELIG